MKIEFIYVGVRLMGKFWSFPFRQKQEEKRAEMKSQWFPLSW